MGCCGGHAFLHRGAAQAACLEKLEKDCKNIRIYIGTKSIEERLIQTPGDQDS
jgi:hypothetical protein